MDHPPSEFRLYAPISRSQINITCRVQVISAYSRISLKVCRASSGYTPLFQDLRSTSPVEFRLSVLIPGSHLRYAVRVQTIRLYFRISDQHHLTSSGYTNFLTYKSVNSRQETTIILLKSSLHRKKPRPQPELSSSNVIYLF